MKSDTEPEYNEKSFILIEKDNLRNDKKVNNETKGEKGEIGKKGEKGDVGQISQTEIDQLKHEITGWVILDLNENMICNVIVKTSNNCNHLNYIVVLTKK